MACVVQGGRQIIPNVPTCVAFLVGILLLQILFVDVVPHKEACCNRNAMECVRSVNDGMLVAIQQLDLDNVWLFRRSAPILASKRHLAVHQVGPYLELGCLHIAC